MNGFSRSADSATNCTWTDEGLCLPLRREVIPQDPDDEPASPLLERIGTERAQKQVLGRRRSERP
jgi:hypothetical protein